MGVDRCFILVRLSQSDSLNRGVSVMFTWDSDLATEAEWAEFVQQLSSKKLQRKLSLFLLWACWIFALININAASLFSMFFPLTAAKWVCSG